MNQAQRKTLSTLALAGITAGLMGCGGAQPAAPATPDAPAAEPAGEKSGCKGEVGEKHACGGGEKASCHAAHAVETQATEPAPAEKAAP